MPRKTPQASTRTWFARYKRNLHCRYCTESDPVCLDFHHHNPHHKKAAIAKLVKYASIARVRAELALCSVVCANCHRKLHARRRQLKYDDPARTIPLTDLTRPNALDFDIPD